MRNEHIKVGDTVTFDGDSIQGGLWEVLELIPAKIKIKDEVGTVHEVASKLVTKIPVNQIIEVVIKDIKEGGRIIKAIKAIKELS